MLRKIFDRIDYRFLILLVAGSIIRIISCFFIRITTDAQDYIFAAEGIINNNYLSFRPPIFPLLIVPFLLISGDGPIAVRCASVTSGILLIIAVYYVFKKASLKIFGDDDIGKEKANYVALLVNFFVSLNFDIIQFSATGQREDLIALFLILLFYFLFIANEKKSKRNYLFIALLCFALTLSHVTTGIFMFITIILYYLIPKFKILEYQVSNRKVFIVTISVLCSFLSWILFCWINFNEPFYTMRIHQEWWQDWANLDLGSTEGIIKGLRRGLTIGIWEEFNALFLCMGIIFTLTTFLYFGRYYKNNRLFFLYLMIFVNFLYLSIFIAEFPIVRLILYFVPILFFLGSIPIINNLYEKKDVMLIVANLFKRDFSISLHIFFFFYLAFYVIIQIFKLFYLISAHQKFQFYFYFRDFILPFSIIYEFFLIILFIYPSYKMDNIV
ncbi:MAG: glycosyltransferase family 39 protein [Promethearchaeota archaeon]